MVKEMEWISVKDKFPESGTACVIVTPTGYMSVTEFLNFDRKNWMYGDEKVMYWMPLPPLTGLAGVVPELWKNKYSY